MNKEKRANKSQRTLDQKKAQEVSALVNTMTSLEIREIFRLDCRSRCNPCFTTCGSYDY